MSANKKVINNLIWRFSERILAQLVTFIVSIVLARLIAPEEYGAIAMVTVFITFANVFVTGGFGNALIQKKDADNVDFSSVFYFNIAFSTLLYCILYVSAPSIARFYNIDILSPVIRVMGLRVIVGGINSVQHAYVSRNMLFKRFFISTLFGTIMSGIAGIWMAYSGLGIWALVGQYLINTITDTIVLWFTVRWRPQLVFSWKKMKEMFSYGWKLLCSSLLDTGYSQMKNLIIAKIYTPTDLAFYERGEQYPNILVTNINTSIGSVLFPVMAKQQDDKNAIKNMTRNAIKISSYIMWPMMMGLAVVAKPLVTIMLTEKWIPCVIFLQIACFTYAFWPIHTANLQAIKAVGRSDIFLKLEIAKKTIGIAILIVSVRYGMLAIALSAVITTILSSFINAYPNRSLLGYKYKEQFSDIIPSMLLSFAMAIIIYPIGGLISNDLLKILLQVVAGITVYLLGSKLFKFEVYERAIEIIKKRKMR